MFHGDRWQLALGVQAAAGHASWVGLRLMLAYQMLDATDSVALVGLQAGTFAFAGLVVAIPAGRVADRAGGAVVASAGLLACVAGTALALSISSVGGALSAAAIIGVGHICALVGQQSLVARLTTSRSTDAAFGTMTALSSVGQLAGPPIVTAAAMIGASGSDHPNTWPGLLACLLLLLIALPSYFELRRAERRSAAGEKARPPRSTLRKVLRTPEVARAILVSCMVIVAVDLLGTFLPVWAVQTGVAPFAVGMLLALRAAFTIVSRVGLSRLIDRFGRRVLLNVSLTLGAAGLIALPFADVWWAIPLMIVLGIGLGIPQPITMAWVVSVAPSGERGAILGARMTVNRFAQVVIPVSVSYFASGVGDLGVFWIAGLFLGGGIVVVALAKIEPDSDSPPEP